MVDRAIKRQLTDINDLQQCVRNLISWCSFGHRQQSTNDGRERAMLQTINWSLCRIWSGWLRHTNGNCQSKSSRESDFIVCNNQRRLAQSKLIIIIDRNVIYAQSGSEISTISSATTYRVHISDVKFMCQASVLFAESREFSANSRCVIVQFIYSWMCVSGKRLLLNNLVNIEVCLCVHVSAALHVSPSCECYCNMW